MKKKQFFYCKYICMECIVRTRKWNCFSYEKGEKQQEQKPYTYKLLEIATNDKLGRYNNCYHNTLQEHS